MRAIVSDESGNFSSVEIGTGPDFTVILARALGGVCHSGVRRHWRAPRCDHRPDVVSTVGVPYSPSIQSNFDIPSSNNFLVVLLNTGLVLDSPQILEVGCRASQNTVYSQPTTINAIEVEKLTYIRNELFC
jgi:hypothetical protein